MVSFLSQMLGSESIEPAELVAYLQMGRRKLRALKYQGLRIQRIRADEKLMKNGESINNRNGNGIQKILSSFARALSCQTPDVFEQLLELLAHQKKTKCSVRFYDKWKLRGQLINLFSNSSWMNPQAAARRVRTRNVVNIRTSKLIAIAWTTPNDWQSSCKNRSPMSRIQMMRISSWTAAMTMRTTTWEMRAQAMKNPKMRYSIAQTATWSQKR